MYLARLVPGVPFGRPWATDSYLGSCPDARRCSLFTPVHRLRSAISAGQNVGREATGGRLQGASPHHLQAATYHGGMSTHSSNQATTVGPFHRAKGVPAFIASANNSCLRLMRRPNSFWPEPESRSESMILAQLPIQDRSRRSCCLSESRLCNSYLQCDLLEEIWHHRKKVNLCSFVSSCC